MSHNQRSGGHRGQSWKEKSKTSMSSSAPSSASAVAAEAVSNRIGGLGITENSGQAATQISSAGLSKLFGGNMLENFTVDNSTYTHAQVRATFYPKFENEKSDQEVRTRMIEMVSKGLATLEVSLKHSGSLFMYAGHEGGAYAKNSFGNMYAYYIFLISIFAWGTQAAKKQSEFNDFLEINRMCISMELVTAVLGDHGQRPREDYVVVTAITELGNGKPKFYSTPEIIAFCRNWRLPTNHVWLFSTRKSVTSFFAAYDALCEEGTATPVCKALDEVADISIPGSKDHIKVQGEILEGLVARIVSQESSKHMEKVLKESPLPPTEGAGLDLGPSLREICAANRTDEKQQIKALLQSVGTSFCPDRSDWFGDEEAGATHSRNADKSVLSKFLQSHPADYSTTKLQEMMRLMREKRFPAAFKCYHNFHKVNSISSDNLFYKMVIHVHSDSAFRRYQKEMRLKPGLWPLYRGFFVDINLFKANKERAAEIAKSNTMVENGSSSTLGKDALADEDANLMIKLKFLTYKLRTFLIRNGLSILFKEGPAAYKTYYLRQMKIWGTSAGKQRELSKMLDEWAVYIRRKYGNKQLSQSIYLSEAETFLEQYAKRSPRNQALIGSAGNFVRAEDFLAIVEGGRDEEGDLEMEREIAPLSPSPSVKDIVPKKEGLIVFFPGKYWQKVADERKRKPYSIMLADKNAPNEEVWRQIEDMCHRTRASAVPVVPDSEGTDTNPFSLDALAVFMFRVLQRVNHPGNLDKGSPNAGYSRNEFEGELVERFGSLVKMPLLKSDRSPLPDPVKSILEEGINLYNLHSSQHGRLDSTKGSYAKEWVKWEKQLREVLFGNTEYLNSVQVPFEFAVKQVLEQLKNIAKGDYSTPDTEKRKFGAIVFAAVNLPVTEIRTLLDNVPFEFAVKQVLEQLKNIAKGDYSTPDTEKRKFGAIVFAAVNLPVTEIRTLLDNLAENNPKVDAFLKDKDMVRSLNRAHVTLAHKRSHGVTAVAGYGLFLHQEVPVNLTALLFSDKLAAFEVCLGSVNGEKVVSKNQWPHLTIWTGEGVAAKEANTLPQLLSEGKATQIELNPPVTVCGTVEFY
ncbi:trna ligase 1 [Quercus suber]|uniref:Trna ligase 1 n=1 Tax=Quercus suber TaxID=58331 RepID=A0AAW0LTN1_QUESU